MAYSKTILLVFFAVLLITAEVSAHRDLIEKTTATTDGSGAFNRGNEGNGGGRGGNGGRYGGGSNGGIGGGRGVNEGRHGGGSNGGNRQCGRATSRECSKGGNGGGKGGRGGRGGHGPETQN